MESGKQYLCSLRKTNLLYLTSFKHMKFKIMLIIYIKINYQILLFKICWNQEKILLIMSKLYKVSIALI